MREKIMPGLGRSSYLLDDRMSLQAKGLLSIITNSSYEQILALQKSDEGFAQSLCELRMFGYVGRFDLDVFEVCLTFAEGAEHV